MKGLLSGAALALVVIVASPASAETSARADDVKVDAAGRTVDLTLSVTDLPAGAGLDPASVQATIDGRRLPVSTVIAASERAEQAPTVLLVVDTSGSMVGQPLTDAKRALHEFVSDAPTSARLGLLRFATRPELVVAPTTERSRLLGAVSGLVAEGETALYDGVLSGLAALGATGDRRLVIVSDGGDTRSKAPLAKALDAGRSSGVIIDAIAFNTPEAVATVLSRLATSGRGKVHRAASAADLSAALTTSVRTFARALAVRVLVPEDVRGSRTIALSVSTPRGVLKTRTEVALGAAEATPTAEAAFWGSRQALLVGCAAIGASVLLATLLLLGGGKQRDRKRVDSLLGRFTTAAPKEAEARSAGTVAQSAIDFADRLAAKRNLQDRLALQLDRAAISMTPAEWLLLKAGVVLGATLLMVLLGANLFIALLAGVALGMFGTSRVLSFRGKRRQKAFETRLPDMLQMTAGSLSAGYSLAQALDGVVREGSEPMATEIGRALAESRLGVPVEATLDAVAERMDSKDFRWVVMAIRVQRDVGGNLAGILTTVCATMRERAMLRRHVRGLSAEGRLSAYILIGLPVFLALYMLTFRRAYILPLYTTPLGIMFMAAAIALLGIGSFWMSRMVKVEI